MMTQNIKLLPIMTKSSHSRSLAARLNSWDTIRYEILNTHIKDLGLKIEESRLWPIISKLYRELSARKLRFMPEVYLSDSWGCPDQVPMIGVPFYLSDSRLARIEEEQTGEVEDSQTIMEFLRHEAGHAYNYAFRLWENKNWKDIFGSFSKPYLESFQPHARSKDFVRHIYSTRYGYTYAQKHPDEDFAETFAVWLMPHGAWRRKYRGWPALKKLLYIDRTMRELRGLAPELKEEKKLHPVESLDLTVAEHYGQRLESYRAAAQGYVDDHLRQLFPRRSGKGGLAVTALLSDCSATLRAEMLRWSGLAADDVDAILLKLRSRSTALRLKYDPESMDNFRMELASLATALAMDYAYTGRLI